MLAVALVLVLAITGFALWRFSSHTLAGLLPADGENLRGVKVTLSKHEFVDGETESIIYSYDAKDAAQRA